MARGMTSQQNGETLTEITTYAEATNVRVIVIISPGFRLMS